MAKFSINEIVVYSGQGVGVVQEIVQKTIAGELLEYYVIYISDIYVCDIYMHLI